MNLLYIGRFFPKKLLSSVLEESRGKTGMSNHNFEMSLINGFASHDDVDLTCITVPSVYTYPFRNKSIYTHSEKYYEKNYSVQSIGFSNLPIINKIWPIVTLCFAILKFFRQEGSPKIDVVINTPSYMILAAVFFAKYFTRKYISVTVIIPDIPMMVTSMGGQNTMKTRAQSVLDKISMKLASNSDHLVLLCDTMRDFFSRPIDYIVMEGIIDVHSMSWNVSSDKLQPKYVLYTGTLRRIFGVMNLIEAFKRIDDPNVELWICGSGECKDDIIKAADSDSRIKFKGLVDTRTSLIYQNQATLLVNPRTSAGEYTKYSFPSKILEYLLAGKPIVAYKLPGMPDEYSEFIYTPVDESVSALTYMIEHVLSMPVDKRIEIGLKGKNFVIENKNSIVQTRRILDMLVK